MAALSARDISLADQRLQRAWRYLLEQWAKLHPGDPVPFLTQVHRTAAMQTAFYAQGRRPLTEVNTLRKQAGLGAIGEAENKRKVTNAPAGKSKHEAMPSLAIDIAFVKKGTARELDWSGYLFLQAAVILRTCDPTIVWGGDWNQNWKSTDEKFIDMPHFQV